MSHSVNKIGEFDLKLRSTTPISLFLLCSNQMSPYPINQPIPDEHFDFFVLSLFFLCSLPCQSTNPEINSPTSLFFLCSQWRWSGDSCREGVPLPSWWLTIVNFNLLFSENWTYVHTTSYVTETKSTGSSFGHNYQKSNYKHLHNKSCVVFAECVFKFPSKHHSITLHVLRTRFPVSFHHGMKTNVRFCNLFVRGSFIQRMGAILVDECEW